MTAAARAELRAAADHAAQAVADCRQIAEQMRAARVVAEQFTRRLTPDAAGGEQLPAAVQARG